MRITINKQRALKKVKTVPFSVPFFIRQNPMSFSEELGRFAHHLVREKRK
jgi:hypothetical protein